MNEVLLQELPLVSRLALSYAPGRAREATLAVLALDWRLGRLMAGASEPMLAQVRLAWWRDMLAQPVATWPSGDPVLEALATGLADQAYKLAPLVDAWEELVADPPLSPNAMERFAAGRVKAWQVLNIHVGAAGEPGPAEQNDIAGNARLWALVDLAQGLSAEEERDVALALAASGPAPEGPLTRHLRPLAVLSALASRAMDRGDLDPLGGRASFRLAMRVGLFGR